MKAIKHALAAAAMAMASTVVVASPASAAPSAAARPAVLSECTIYVDDDGISEWVVAICAYGSGQFRAAAHCFSSALWPSYWVYGAWKNAGSVSQADCGNDNAHSYHIEYRNGG